MGNKICVYAITKNEEKFVDKWYESMKEADAVVVLDTGSTDNTVDKLRSHGVIVEVKEINPWRFDVARNESLKLVPDDCNILISTDLDEILEPCWSKPLREEWIEGKHERANYLYTWSHLEDGSDGRVFVYNKIHSKNWEWRAPVHELLYNKNTNSNLYPPEVCLNLCNKIHLHHYPDKSKSRSSYLPLLELRVKENPDDFYGMIYLGHEYFYRKKYGKAIQTLTHVLENFNDHYTDLEKASCYLFIGDCFAALESNSSNKNTKLDNHLLSIESYNRAIEIDNTYIEPYLNCAKEYINNKQYELAEAMVKMGLKNSYRHYTWLERDTSWSYEPWDLLNLAAWYSGKKKEAIAYAAKALSFEPTNKRLLDNLKICSEKITNLELLK